VLLLLGAVAYWLFRQPINRAAQPAYPPVARTWIRSASPVNSREYFLVGLLVASLIFVIGYAWYLGLWSFTLAFWALTMAHWFSSSSALVPGCLRNEADRRLPGWHMVI